MHVWSGHFVSHRQVPADDWAAIVIATLGRVRSGVTGNVVLTLAAGVMAAPLIGAAAGAVIRRRGGPVPVSTPGQSRPERTAWMPDTRAEDLSFPRAA